MNRIDALRDRLRALREQWVRHKLSPKACRAELAALAVELDQLEAAIEALAPDESSPGIQKACTLELHP